jgi:hypothetical protein
VVEKMPTCQLCQLELASGAFQAEFSSGDELVLLCAQCGFARAWATWHGHMTKKLRSLKIVATLMRKGDENYVEPVEKTVALAPTFVFSEYTATFASELFDPIKVELGGFATEWAALERARQISHGLAKSLEPAQRKKARLDPNVTVPSNHWHINTAVTRVNASADIALETERDYPDYSAPIMEEL